MDHPGLGDRRSAVNFTFPLDSQPPFASGVANRVNGSICADRAEPGGVRLPSAHAHADLQLVSLRLRHRRDLLVSRRTMVRRTERKILRTQSFRLSLFDEWRCFVSPDEHRDCRLLLDWSDTDVFIRRKFRARHDLY